ncbi:MAG: DNA replication and repair protein RecF [Caldisericia bacterium]
MIKTLETSGFRILDNLKIGFESGLNIISGENATGKTSVLEAIGYCLRGKSILSSKDFDTCTFGKDYFRIVLGIEGTFKEKIIVFWDGRKRISIGEKPVRSARELMRRFKVVFIGPKSVEIALGSPSLRRGFLDETASQMNPEWAETISEYRATVKDRNSLLGGEFIDYDLLEVLTSQLIKFGKNLREIRREVAENISSKVAGDDIEVFIDDSKELSKEAFGEKLYLEKIRKSTLIGPHRDDCYFVYRGNRVEKFASTGEARRITMVMKLASANMIAEKSGIEPLILADDLLAELDERNSLLALEKLREFSQVILTNAGENPPGEYNLIRTEEWQDR